MRNYTEAKKEALKHLIKKMRHLEAEAMDDDESESLAEEASESPLDEILEPEMEDKKPGKMVEADEDDSFEDEKRAFMKRSSSAPVKGKTKTIMMAFAMKPKIGRKTA